MSETTERRHCRTCGKSAEVLEVSDEAQRTRHGEQVYRVWHLECGHDQLVPIREYIDAVEPPYSIPTQDWTHDPQEER